MWLATRYGLNQACSSSPRACASATAVPSGSQPGSLPWVPVSHCDQGSRAEGQKESAAGRTWRITAFRRRRTAVSRRAVSSARCSRAARPDAEGQSTFCTVAIHIPRNSRAAARPAPPPPAGRSRTRAGRAAASAGPAPAAAASAPAAPASSPRRPMYAM